MTHQFARSRRRAHRSCPLLRPAAARRAAILRTVALAAVLGMCLVAAPSPGERGAEAAVLGRMVWVGGWPIGTFLSSTGEYVYCIEPGASEPKSSQQGGQLLSSVPAYTATSSDVTGWSGTMSSGPLTGARLRQVNYVLWEHGRTEDGGTAAAVQIAVWMLRGDPGARPWLDHHLAWLRSHGGGSYVEQAAQLADEARARALEAAPPAPGPLVIQRVARGRSAQHGEHGEYGGIVRYPEGTTELRIAGGVFADGERTLTVGAGNSGEVEWRAAPHDDGWDGRHEVSVRADWRLSNPGWTSAIRVFSPSTAGQQRLAAGAARAAVSFSGELEALDTGDTGFSPTLSTRVPARFVATGGVFADTVSLAADTGSNPWPSRIGAGGAVEFAPVVADGVVYGPFDAPLTPSADPPPGAPVAGRARLVAEDGPGEYPVASDAAVNAAGYYSWVWSIREEEQLPEVRDGALLPSGYRYSDRFGLAEEGQVAPMRLRWTTRLEDREISSGESVLRDRVTARVGDDVWLRDGAGEPIPVRVRLTVFQSATEPRRRSEAPDGASPIASGFVELREAGAEIAAEPIALPPGTGGWVTVQACLLDEDQPDEWRGYAEEWCDDYGVPEETARVVPLQSLGLTGAPAGATLAAGPILGFVLAYSGASAMLTGAILRSSRKRGRR